MNKQKLKNKHAYIQANKRKQTNIQTNNQTNEHTNKQKKQTYKKGYTKLMISRVAIFI